MMTRPKCKGQFCNHKLIKKKNKFLKFNIKTWYRHSNIPNDLVGMKISIHNGNTFIKKYISPNMVKHKIGEFAFTRKRYIYKKKEKKKKK